MRVFSTFLVVTSCLSMLTFGILIQQNTQRWISTWGDGLQMSVYINPEEKTSEAVKLAIEKLPDVESVQIISAEQSFNDFKSQMASFGSLTMNASEIIEAIPTSLLVQVKSGTNSTGKMDVLKNTAQQVQSISGVQSVDYGQTWVQKFSDIVEGFKFLAALLGGLLFLTAAYVIFNSIQVLVLEKQSEVEILELLGADRSFIQRPFLRQGLLIGSVSGLAAVLVNIAVVELLKVAMTKHAVLASMVSQVQFLDLGLSSLVFLMGGIIGIASSYICVRKINTGWLAAGTP